MTSIEVKVRQAMGKTGSTSPAWTKKSIKLKAKVHWR